jgi:hypothetical protein
MTSRKPKPGPSPEALAAKRTAAIKLVQESLERLHAWHGKSEDEISSEQRAFDEAFNEHMRNIRRALRLGLADHCLIKHYVQTRRVSGGRQQLRDVRAGLEKGVRQPPASDELTLESTIRDLLRRYEQEHGRRCTQARAYQLLVAGKTIPPMSRQGFHKLLQRLHILHLFPERRQG